MKKNERSKGKKNRESRLDDDDLLCILLRSQQVNVDQRAVRTDSRTDIADSIMITKLLFVI